MDAQTQKWHQSISRSMALRSRNLEVLVEPPAKPADPKAIPPVSSDSEVIERMDTQTGANNQQPEPAAAVAEPKPGEPRQLPRDLSELPSQTGRTEAAPLVLGQKQHSAAQIAQFRSTTRLSHLKLVLEADTYQVDFLRAVYQKFSTIKYLCIAMSKVSVLSMYVLNALRKFTNLTELELIDVQLGNYITMKRMTLSFQPVPSISKLILRSPRLVDQFCFKYCLGGSFQADFFCRNLSVIFPNVVQLNIFTHTFIKGVKNQLMGNVRKYFPRLKSVSMEDMEWTDLEQLTALLKERSLEYNYMRMARIAGDS